MTEKNSEVCLKDKGFLQIFTKRINFKSTSCSIIWCLKIHGNFSTTTTWWCSTNGLKISIQKPSIKLIHVHVHDVVSLKINYKHDLIIISKIKTIRPNDTLKKVNHKIHTD